MAKRVKLNKVATAWLRALRSGDFKQITNQLTKVDPATGEILGCCCLGVLCELAAKQKVVTANSKYSEVRYDGEMGYLPESVMAWAGLATENGAFGNSTLSAENDGGKSFKQIARIIEQKAKELFV